MARNSLIKLVVELLKLGAHPWSWIHRVLELRCHTILSLLARQDAFRRPAQLGSFVAACEMDALGRLGFESRAYPQGAYLLGAAEAARTVLANPFVERSLSGPVIGKAMREERLRALKKTQALEITFRVNIPAIQELRTWASNAGDQPVPLSVAELKALVDIASIKTNPNQVVIDRKRSINPI